MWVIGVDEAGRGSIIGPLVIGGISTDDISALRNLKVKDSKQLSPHQRTLIYRGIIAAGIKVKYVEIPPSLIDRYVLTGKKHGRLNYLEAIYMAKVINDLEGDLALVDAADTNTELFSNQIKEGLNREIMLISAHHADSLYPPVSAASIVAKVNRDEIIAGLRRIYGDFGSGYPSDPTTRKYLKKWLEEGDMPPIVRKSWKTLNRI